MCISHSAFEILWATSDSSQQDGEEQEYFFGLEELWLHFFPRWVKAHEFQSKSLDLFLREWQIVDFGFQKYRIFGVFCMASG